MTDHLTTEQGSPDEKVRRALQGEAAVRSALAMYDAGYHPTISLRDAELLLKSYDSNRETINALVGALEATRTRVNAKGGLNPDEARETANMITAALALATEGRG